MHISIGNYRSLFKTLALNRLLIYLPAFSRCGKMTEWLKVLTANPVYCVSGTEGSNPSLSAIFAKKSFSFIGVVKINMREIGIGILGFGTVGAGVVDALYKNGEIIEARSGIKPTIKKIADLDIITDRGITISDDILTTDALSVIENEDVEVIVELIGGSKIAKELIEHALCLGKPVVTANKALLAEFGHELYNLAEKYDTGIYYEAAVGGGIPVLRAQREGLICNKIESIYGILNGTCNYILSKMESDKLSFEKVLSDAQKLGYAETPPDLDIDGIDTAHKAVLLASMAYGSAIPMSACPTSGIRNISEADILNSDELGYRIKLLSIIKKIDGLIEI